MSIGSGFRLEKEMGPLVLDWLRPQVSVLKPEFYLNHFRADYAGIELFPSRVTQRMNGRRKSPYSKTELMKFFRLNNLPAWWPLHKRIIAIEMKLGRKAEVVDQAIEKTRWADETWIAMPREEAAKLLNNNAYCLQEWGIGVLSVTPEGCHPLRGARTVFRMEFDAFWNAYVAERFWRYLRSGYGVVDNSILKKEA